MVELPATRPVDAERLAGLLRDARARTQHLTGDLSGERLFGPKTSIVNPPLWEIGHVGFFHDYFALRTLYGLADYQHPRAAQLYDSSSIEHFARWDLPLPDIEETWHYLDAVQAGMLARLPDSGAASEAQSYVYQLTLLHEDMHGEAFTYTRQTLAYPPPAIDGEAATTPGGGPLPGDVSVPASRHQLGSGGEVPFRFDNEKPAHEVDVPAFRIARAPVTNAEFAEFVAADGYQHAGYWSHEGWRWRLESNAEAPQYWAHDDRRAWRQRWFDRWLPLAPHHPVTWVNAFEAEAYCAWAGRRLPTEAEWEVAASRVPDGNRGRLLPGGRLYPWGDERCEIPPANLDARQLNTVDVGALAGGDSALGCRQMLGNVWEWTASPFQPYPGFRIDLYRDYSAPWFEDGRRVLRGGSWATRARLVHNSYRNFFAPERNDTPSGFRTCAL